MADAWLRDHENDWTRWEISCLRERDHPAVDLLNSDAVSQFDHFAERVWPFHHDVDTAEGFLAVVNSLIADLAQYEEDNDVRSLNALLEGHQATLKAFVQQYGN
jgi:hypothetical protein